MAGQSLSEFLRQQKDQQQQSNMSAAEVRAEWVEAVRNLVELVQAWLRLERADGLLDLAVTQAQVDEERLGSYEVPVLEITAAGKVVTMQPVARIIIGGLGRVDLVCGPKRRLLVRNAEKLWFVSSREPRDKGQELNEGTFKETMKLLLS
jgi:hypothetical protein